MSYLRHEMELYLAEQRDREEMEGAEKLPLLTSQLLQGTRSLDPGADERISYAAEMFLAEDRLAIEQEEERLRNQKNVLWDMVGSGLWAFADTGSFGVLGALTPDDIEEMFMPTTAAGRIAAGIGGTAGFFTLPLKTGAYLAKKAAAIPIKAIGKQTGASILKKSSKEAAPKITSTSGEVFAKDFKKKVGSIFEQPKMLSSIKADKEFVKHAHRNIDNILDNGILAGKVGKVEANALRKAYKDNITSRPLNDFVDLLTRNSTGRGMRALGYMAHEATMFGAIDAIHERFHAWGADKGYDWSNPLWGVIIGSSFGALKWFNFGGKSAVTAQDFKQGLKAYVGWGAKKSIDNAKAGSVPKMAAMLGADLKRIGENESKVLVSYKGKNIEVDLAHWDANGRNISIQAASIKGYGKRRRVGKEVESHILKLALHKKRAELGPQLMNWAVKSEFEQMKKTFPLMIAGSLLMNARTWYDMAQGQEMDSTDLIFNLILGAFLNRKGIPREYDVGGTRMKTQMNHLRGQLDILGVSTKNLYQVMPTLDGKGRDPIINPINADPELKAIVKEMDALGMGSSTIDKLTGDSRNNSLQYMRTFAGEDFRLFDEFKRYYYATTKHRYVATDDMISVADARSIQDRIRSLNKGKIVPNRKLSAKVRGISRERQVIDKEVKKLGFQDVAQLTEVIESGKEIIPEAQKLYDRYVGEYQNKILELTGKEAADLSIAEFSLYKGLKQMPENGVELFGYDLTNKVDIKNALDLLEASRIRGDVETANYIKAKLDAELKVIKNNDMLEAKEVISLENKIEAADKSIESLAYKQIGGIKDVAELRNLLDDRVVSTYEDFKSTIWETQSAIMKALGYVPGEKRTNNIGTIPGGIAFNADLNLHALAKEGKLEWLTRDGVKLKGTDAQHEITDFELAVSKINKAAEVFYQGNPDGNYVNVIDINQVRDLYRIVRDTESNINNSFGTVRNDYKFGFSDMDHIIGQIATRELFTDTKKVGKSFDPTTQEFQPLFKALAESKVIEPELGTAYILQDISRIKFVGTDGVEVQSKSARSFINSVQKIVRAFNQSEWGVQTGKETVEISLESVENLRIAFNNLGYGGKISNDRFFEHWANEISYRSIQVKLKDSNISNEDVSLLEKLTFIPAGTDKGDNFTLGKYSKTKTGLPGWTVHRVKSVFTDKISNSVIQKYNFIVNDMFKKSKGVISPEKDVVLIRDKMTIAALNNTLIEARMLAGKSSKEQLALFLQTADQSKLVDVLKTLSAYDGEMSSKVMEWLVADGIVKPIVFNNEIQYMPNNAKFAREKYQINLLDRLNRYDNKIGTIADVISAARQTAIDSNNASLEYGTDRTMTVNSFFNRYLNHENGYQSKKPEDMTDFLRKTIYETKDGKDVFRGEPAIKDLMGKMKFKPEEINQAFDDAIKIITTRINSIDKHVISYDRMMVRVSDVGRKVYTSPFTKFMDEIGVDWLFIEGRAKDYGKFGKRYFIDEELDPWQANSDKLNKNSIEKLTKIQGTFNNLLTAFQGPKRLGTAFAFEGITPFRFGNSAQVIGLANAHHKTITEAFIKFKERYYDQASPTYKKRLDNLESRLKLANKMGDEHIAAFRALISERMLKGKGYNKTLEFLESPDGSENFANLYRRFSLFNTNSANRVTRDIAEGIRDYIKNNSGLHPHIDHTIIDKYLKRPKRKEINMVTWADKTYADLKKDPYIVDQLRKFGTTWDTLLSGRTSESGVDSIVYISSDFRHYLNTIGGAKSNEPNSIKPIITSLGEDIHFFGKTMFVWSPKIQENIFAKNKELDMIATQTADKLNSTPSEKLVNMSIKDLMQGPDLSKFHQQLPLDAIGIIKVTDVNKPGAISPSLFNFTSNPTNKKVFDGLFATDIQSGINEISKAFENPFVAKEILKIATGKRDLDMEVMSGSSADHQGTMLNILNRYEHAIPDMFGDALLMNVLKKKFIDPVVKPVSEYRFGSEIIRWGGQGPMIQDLALGNYNLAPTINKGGEILQYGQQMLPNSARSAKIEYPGKDLEVYVIGEGGPNRKAPVVNAKKYYKSVTKVEIKKDQPKLSDKEIDDLIDVSWNQFRDSAEPMGMLHDYIKYVSKGKFQLATATVRYPRTRPNDLMFLRIKDFLSKEYGESVIVNKFDVLNVQEGDYDSDVSNFFWATNPAMRQHIQRSAEKWVHTVDETILRPEMPSVALIPENISKNEQAWNQYDSNRRVVDKIGIGVVQRNLKLSNFIRDVARKSEIKDEKGRVIDTEYILYEKELDGAKHKLIVDWDFTAWHERTALESQHLLDYVRGVDKGIFESADTYRWDYLMPKKDDSYSRQDFISPETGQFDPNISTNIRNQQLRSEKGSPTKRIRIFRHLEWHEPSQTWKERELHTIDKEAIKLLMRRHNKFLSISQEVNISGRRKTPNYQEMIDVSKDYFEYFSPKVINDNIYRGVKYAKLQNKLTGMYENIFTGYGNDAGAAELASHFGSISKTKADYKKRLKRAQYQISKGKEVPLPEKGDLDVYTWYNKNFFDKEVMTNLTDISQGDFGSPLERTMWQFYRANPLQAKIGNEMLKGDQYARFLKLEQELLGADVTGEGLDMARINELAPKLHSDLNIAVSQIKKLNFVMYTVANDRSMGYKAKAKNLENLKKKRSEYESGIWGMLPAKYKKNRSNKNLPSFKFVHVGGEREQLRAMTQFYLTDWMINNIHLRSYNKKMVDDVRKAKMEWGKEWGQYYQNTSTEKFGENTILNEILKEQRFNQLEPKEIHANTEGRLTNLYNEYGALALWHYAAPKKMSSAQTEMTLGIFEGNVINMVVEPSKTFSQVIKFLGKVANKQIEGIRDIEIAAREADGLLDMATRMYTTTHNYFHKNIDQIPKDDLQLFNVMRNFAPDMPNFLKNAFNKYTDLRFTKVNNEYNPFSFGIRENGQMDFFRKLFNMAGEGEQFREYTQGLSKLNQLSIENEYMHPMKYAAIMHSIESKANDIMTSVFPSVMDANTGTNIPISKASFADNPLFVMLGGGNATNYGYKLNTLSNFTRYQKDMLKRLFDQTNQTLQSKSDVWNTMKKEHLVNGYDKTGKCG